MKISKIAMVSIILLAIITLGAASASEDADVLSVSDDSDIVDVSIDENEAIAIDSDDEIVGDGPEEKYNVTINVYNPDEVCFGEEISIWGSVDASDEECEYEPEGEVTLYLNDEEIATSDRNFNFDYYLEEFGQYDFKLKYSGDENFNPAEVNFSYNLTNSMYRISVDDDLTYGTNRFGVYAPVNDRCEIEITINGKKFKVYEDDDMEEFYCDASALNYGVNTVKIYYPGDEDFAEYSDEVDITLMSYIRCENDFIYFGDSAEIYLELPGDATGTLKVYSIQYDEDDNEIHVEIASADAEDGDARVLLSDFGVGSHEIYANFTGSVEVNGYSEWITVRPIIMVPKAIITGEDAYVTVETSDDADELVSVSYRIPQEDDYEYDEEEFEYTFLASANTENGQAKIPLSGLDEGNYRILVEYGDYYSDTFTLYVVDEYDVNINITDYNENVIIGQYGNIDYQLPAYAEGIVTLAVDGKVVDTSNEDNDNYFYFDTSGLSIGEHTLTLNFTSATQGTASADAKFNVVSARIYIPDRMNLNDKYHMSANNIEVDFNENATGIVRILIDGEEYQTENIDVPATEDYSAIYSLSEVSRGKHNVTVIYSDNKYGEVSKSKTVDFGYVIVIEEECIYGYDNVITVDVPDDLGNGDLTITLDGNKLDFTSDSSIIKINPSKLSLGQHIVIVKYAGDDFYPAGEFNDTFDVYATIMYPDGDVLAGSDKGISLILPGDAKGKLDVTVFTVDDDGEDVIYDSQLVSFVDGKAFYSYKDLPEQYMHIEASYTGDDYEIEPCDIYLEIGPVDWGDTYLDVGQNKTLTFITSDTEPGQLRVVLSKIVDYDAEWDDEINVLQEFDIVLENGKATHTFTHLGPGNYHLFIAEEFLGGGLRGFQGGHSFYVSTPLVNAKTGSFEIGNIPSMTVKLPEDANGKINVIVYENFTKSEYDVYKTAEVSVNGPTTIDLNTIIKDAGNFKVLLNYTGNYGEYEDYYYTYKISESIKMNPNLEVEATQNVSVGDAVFISVALNETITGNVLLTVGTNNYTVEVVSGKGSTSVLGLPAGEYDVTATFEGKDVFDKAKSTASFKVNKLTPSITISTLDSVVEQSDLAVEVTIPGATGTVIINGKEYALDNGTASATISNVEVGELTVEVSYGGDDKYVEASKNKTVTVNPKASPELNASADNIIVGSDAVVNVLINEAATGQVTVNGTVLEISNGKGTAKLSGLAAGDYTVDVEFAGDANFAAQSTKVSFKVSKLTPSIAIDSPDSAVAGSDVTVSVTVPGATGSVIINGKEYALDNGAASALISNVEVGQLAINVSYAGDEKYLGGSNSKTVNVHEKMIPNLQVSVSDISVGSDAVVNVAIDEDATGKITVNGQEVTMADGKGSIKLSGLVVGDYTVDVAFAGDSQFTAKNATASFKVSKVQLNPTEDIIPTPAVSKALTFSINLPDDATGSLTVAIGENNYTAAIENGKATIQISDLEPGEYNATVAYSGDAKYAPIIKDVNAKVIVDPKITAKDTAVLYSANGKFTVTVYGTDGKLASGTEVIFTISGKQVGKTKTNANGIATYVVKNVPGTYKITAKALGVSITKKLTVKHVVALKSVAVKRSAKKLVLQATLAKVNGKYLKSKQVTFKFNGKTYKAKTNVKGVAKVTIKSNVLKKLKAGKNVAYQATYGKDTVKKTVKVKK